METKKIVGIVVAALLVLVTGIGGVTAAIRLNENLFSAADILEDVNVYGNDVALIYVNGTIQDLGEDVGSILNGEYRHKPTVNQINELAESSSNKGIMLYLDTPGGGVLESDEVYLALMEYKEITGRPVYAYMHSMAASGGYYIACAADTIICNRNGLTGSLGVVFSFTDYSGLYEKLGIETREYASGPFKASVAEEDRSEEDDIYEAMVDEYYNQFVDIIAAGRGMSISAVKILADGRLYTAQQAYDESLVDVIGDYDDALSLIQADTGYGVKHYPLSADISFFDTFFASVTSIIPKSDNQTLLEVVEDSNPVEFYYVLQN